MVESLDLEMVGSVRHPPLQACIVKNGLSIPTRIYKGDAVCNHESCGVLVVVSEVQIPADLILCLSEEFVEWSISEKAGAMLVLDSYSKTIESGHTIDDDDDSNETVKGAASTESATTLEFGIDRMEQGAIGGLTGVILNEASRRALMRWHYWQNALGQCKEWGLMQNCTGARRLDELLPAIKLDSEPLLEEARRIEGGQEMMSVLSISHQVQQVVEILRCSANIQRDCVVYWHFPLKFIFGFIYHFHELFFIQNGLLSGLQFRSCSVSRN